MESDFEDRNGPAGSARDALDAIGADRERWTATTPATVTAETAARPEESATTSPGVGPCTTSRITKAVTAIAHPAISATMAGRMLVAVAVLVMVSSFPCVLRKWFQ